MEKHRKAISLVVNRVPRNFFKVKDNQFQRQSKGKEDFLMDQFTHDYEQLEKIIWYNRTEPRFCRNPGTKPNGELC